MKNISGIGCILLSLLVGYLVVSRQQGLRAQYERGVHVVYLHQKLTGHLPSRWFRDVAFEWGDPQTQADLDSIDEIINWEIEHSKRYDLSSDIRNQERVRIALSETIRYLKSLPKDTLSPLVLRSPAYTKGFPCWIGDEHINFKLVYVDSVAYAECGSCGSLIKLKKDW